MTWRNTLLPQTGTITEAIQVLDGAHQQIALVVDAEGRLVGSVTDGDIRRGILRQIPFECPVTQVMNPSPIVADPSFDDETLIDLMKEHTVHQLPVVDAQRRVVGLAVLDTLLRQERRRPNWVVLMAGGQGKRLRPLTESVPKPLLNVGGQPLIETIICNMARQGFVKFYISVNYRAEMIKNHCRDGRQWGVEIRYLEESEPLGTAGPLALIDERPAEPLVVTNGDLLTKVNFGQMLAYQAEQQALATMGVREYSIEVPFGVVHVDDGLLASIEEKPVQRFLVNAGVYVLDPAALDLVAPGRPLDMPELFSRIGAAGQRAAAFPVHEYWLDIGRLHDFNRANEDFAEIFPGA